MRDEMEMGARILKLENALLFASAVLDDSCVWPRVCGQIELCRFCAALKEMAEALENP